MVFLLLFIILILLAWGGYSREEVIGRHFTDKEELEKVKSITDRLMVEKETAEAAAEVRVQFLANMSHEMRTPMNAIMGMTDLVLEATQLTDMQRKNLSIVRCASRKLLHLINGILDLSKIESGNTELLHVPFELRNIITEAMSICHGLACGKSISLSMDINSDIPNDIIGDPHKLYQIIINLISNAVKFTDTGAIKLSVTRVYRDTKVFTLFFSVSDTGIGIPTHLIPKLFMYFGQLDSSMTKKYGGSGLGLAISKAFVEMMGGTIWVESTVGVGSTFHFLVNCTLP